MSVGQHVVTTTVTASPQSSNYHGAAWVLNDPIGSDLSPDADGEFGSNPAFLVDLSHMLSRSMGKQLPMCATYRVTGIKIGIQNVDDADDNDRGAFFSGYIYSHEPSKHKIDALQAMRAVEKHGEADDLDAMGSLFQVNRAYQGFRFNWSDDAQLSWATNAQSTPAWGTITGKDEYNMAETFNLYTQGLDDFAADKFYTLWTYRTGAAALMRWACSLNNASHEDDLGLPHLIEQPAIDDFHFQTAGGRHLDVVGGLMVVEVRNCNTIPNGDVSPDDYNFQIQIEVEGWNTW